MRYGSMISAHFIETWSNSGGGIPRIAKTIKASFPDDKIFAVNDVGTIALFFDFYKILQRKKAISVVFVHNIYSLKAIFFASLLAILVGAKLVITSHGATNNSLVKKSRKKKAYLRIFVTCVGHFASKFHFLNQGELEASYIKQWVKEKVILFSYPILLDGDPMVRQSREASGGDLKLVFYSRVEVRKGIYVLIDAIVYLQQNNYDVKLFIHGPIEDKEFLAYIDKYPFIFYRGAVSQKDYLKISLDYDVYCLPSFGEAHSLALYEHIFLGMPCIVSKEANPPQVEGVIVYGNAIDSQKLAKTIIDNFNYNKLKLATLENIKYSTNYNNNIKFEILKKLSSI